MSSGLWPLLTWDSEATWRTFEDGTFHEYLPDGVEVQKSSADLDRYKDLIEVSQPDVVIETGTREGGSALWFQDQGLSVITIDLNPEAGAQARKAHEGHGHIPNIEWMSGWSSVDARLGFEVRTRLQRGQRVMVSLDSDHHKQHVMAEVSLWSAFVTPGCYMVIEDACFDMWDSERARVGGASIPERGGPLLAIQESARNLERYGFWRDESIEGLHPVSHSPVGWWRRDDS